MPSWVGWIWGAAIGTAGGHRVGMASWVCDRQGHTGTCTWCEIVRSRLEVLSMFWTRGSPFSFCPGPPNYLVHVALSLGRCIGCWWMPGRMGRWQSCPKSGQLFKGRTLWDKMATKKINPWSPAAQSGGATAIATVMSGHLGIGRMVVA